MKGRGWCSAAMIVQCSMAAIMPRLTSCSVTTLSHLLTNRHKPVNLYQPFRNHYPPQTLRRPLRRPHTQPKIPILPFINLPLLYPPGTFPMKILLLSDSLSLADTLSIDHCCQKIEPCDDVIREIKFFAPDLLILPFLPETPLTIRDIRLAKLSTPIMILSSVESNRDYLIEKISSLTSGADDVIRVPFDQRELTAKILALVRRANNHTTNVISIGNISLDLTSRIVFANGIPVPLTGKEYSIFEMLLLRKNRVQGKVEMLDYLYNGIDEPDIKILDVFLCRIRKKMEKLVGKGNCPIETVWGRGWVVRDRGEGPIPYSTGATPTEHAKNISTWRN